MSVWACSDLHGQKVLFDKIRNFIKDDDIVYFLGDAGDRKPYGWQIIKEILNDDRFIYLKGNHEDLLIKGYDEYYSDDDWRGDIELWIYNGGQTTMDQMLAASTEERDEIVSKLRILPLTAEYHNINGKLIHMSHAGFTPGRNEPKENDWLWDRKHLFDLKNWAADENMIVVHGHSPVPFLARKLKFFDPNLSEDIKPGAYWYCENHKVDIDCGAHYTGVTTLLNLDTFEEKIFTL